MIQQKHSSRKIAVHFIRQTLTTTIDETSEKAKKKEKYKKVNEYPN